MLAGKPNRTPAMQTAPQHYAVFDTAAGYCGIAWSASGVTRFQLPTSDAAATERLLRRRCPSATAGPPPPPIAAAVALVRRYFAGEAVDFSAVTLDLGDAEPFFREVYAAARRVGWGRTTTYGALARDLGAGPEARPRRRPGDGEEPGRPARPLPPGAGRRRQARRLLRAGRRPRPRRGCSNSKACASTSPPAQRSFGF